MQNPQARYRLSDVEKHIVKDELRALLIESARNHELITYSEICNRLNSVSIHPHSFVFAHLLREVCHEELARGSGQLCALVVSKTTGIPGAGYFRAGAESGRVMPDLVAAWQDDVEAVFARWEPN